MGLYDAFGGDIGPEARRQRQEYERMRNAAMNQMYGSYLTASDSSAAHAQQVSPPKPGKPEPNKALLLLED